MQQEIVMKASYDVVVIGGGVAGCAAALAARRHGKTVLLIEKLTVLGGLATTGHIAIYLPLDDGYGRQVIGGISEELLKLSAKYVYYGDDYSRWKEKGMRYECKFNAPAFSLALEEALLDEGVEILYDTLFVGAVVENNACKSILTQSKSGELEFGCKAVVDASGDADVFHRCSQATAVAPNNLAIWLYATEATNLKTQLRGGADAPGLKLVSLGTVDTSKSHDEISRPYYGDSCESITRFVVDSHKRLLDCIKLDSSVVPASLPGMAQIRMARRIEGCYVLSTKDANMHFEDSIGGTGDWRKPGPVYEIPYRTLIGSTLGNVISAGRCISTSEEAWEIIRCIPQAALTGQAAGSAASLAIDGDVCLQSLDVESLRETLRKDGVILDVNKR
jgi:hypothetical protein